MRLALLKRGFATLLFTSSLVAGASLPMTPLAAQAATAVVAPTQAKDYIQGLSQQAIDLLTGSETTEAEKVRRFRTLLVANFDIPTIGRFVLGRYWRTASAAQQKEFVGLFEEMIVSMYKQRLNEYRGQRLRTQTAAVDGTGKYVMVQSLVFDPDKNANVSVEWRVSRSAPPKIVDVSVEGMSMGLTQRSEFASVIERNGGQFEGLLLEMRKKYIVAPAPKAAVR
jgi:phospholipid transport system substrate-binding protein